MGELFLAFIGWKQKRYLALQQRLKQELVHKYGLRCSDNYLIKLVCLLIVSWTAIGFRIDLFKYKEYDKARWVGSWPAVLATQCRDKGVLPSEVHAYLNK